MSCSPAHEYQMLPQELDYRPTCDESIFFDETWKSGEDGDSGLGGSDDSNESLSDCVPTTVSSPFEVQPATHEQNSPITGLNAILGGQVNAYRWQTRTPQSWTTLDVALWIQCMAASTQTNNIQSSAFADVDGPALCKMSMDEFVQREPAYGPSLYMAFQNQFNNNYQHYQQQAFLPRPALNDQDCLTSIERYINYNNISFDKDDTFPSLPPLESLLPAVSSQSKMQVLKTEPVEDSSESDAESEASSTNDSPKTARRGRSKGKLWEFVRNLLLDDATNPTIIKWEDRTNGVFRIVRSDQVAKLWGVRKSNPTMTYEKMSRALRYYYRKDILERIDGRRLVYKFGSRSNGWKL